MMGWYHDGAGWGGWVFMMVAMVAFWGLVALALIVIFRGTQRSDTSKSAHRDPQQILDERFARGEINDDEYQARRSVLRDTGDPRK